jgi:predicted short-subunit dehydrogenase-like oxidoreductase (DUF2520 family)
VKNASFALVGAGKVGSALAYGLTAKGYTLLGVASKNRGSARKLADAFQADFSTQAADIARLADIVFITTPDNVIAEVAAAIAAAGGFRPGQTVFHVCGSVGASVLAPAAKFGANTGAMHPLKAFVQRGAAEFSGVYFALDGDEAAMAVARTLVRDLSGKYLLVPEGQRVRYHTAACIASNYLVSLMHWAGEMFRSIGLPEQDAVRAFLPLIEGTVDNIRRVGTVQALSGPISRGDDKTVAAHLQALPNTRGKKLYVELAHYTLAVAAKKGSLSKEQVDLIQEVLTAKREDQYEHEF